MKNDNRPSWGLANPALDEEMETYYRNKYPQWNDEKILEKMNETKKKATFFTKKNSKKNSTKKTKKDKDK